MSPEIPSLLSQKEQRALSEKSHKGPVARFFVEACRFVSSQVSRVMKRNVHETRELTPEQIEKIIAKLHGNFESNNEKFPDLHPNIEWAAVEKSLRARPDIMWSLFKMEETGGKVDVTLENANAFLFEDTSPESPHGRLNVVYDAKAETRAKGIHKAGFGFLPKGNAVDMANNWCVELESEAQFWALKGKIPPLDSGLSESWLKTPEPVRAVGDALYTIETPALGLVIAGTAAHFFGPKRGFRCAKWLPKPDGQQRLRLV